MAAEIKVPVRLEVLQESISQIRSTLANLKPESSGWKELSNILRTMEKEALNLQATMSKPFGTQAQFSNAEKSVDKLDDALERARITMGRIKFSDLKLNPAETAELKKLQQELKDIENEVTKFKADIKQNLQLSDIWDSLVELDPNAVTHSFDEIVKTVQNRVSKLQAEAKKAKEAFNDSQAGARKGELTQKLLGDGAKNVLTDKLDKDIFNQYFQNTKNGLAFKSNQKGPFYDWIKANLTLSDAQYQEINDLSAKALQAQLSKMDFSKNLSEATKAQDTNRAAQSNMTAKNAEFEQAKAVLAALGIEIDKVNDKQASMGARTAEVSGKVQSFQEHLTNGRRALLDASGASDQMRSALNSLRTALNQADAQFLKLQRTTQTFNQMKMAVINFMGFNQVLNLTKRAVKEALSHIKELDTVMNRISIVTDMSTGDLWNQVDAYSKMAQTYGVSIKGAYEVSQIYYQQGLKTNDVLILTNETLKLSKISGLDYAQTTDYMTTAIRGFKMEMSEASKVVDVYSALAAHTAVSSEELAVAMSKTASSMESVGSTFEETSAMIGTMVAVTRESATNIGSALKSIAARYGEMKKDPMTLIDGDGEAIAFNKVDAALQSVGISMKTADGQFREFTDVIIELSEKWNTLESTQQRYIATQFAGNRQQSRFLALVSNADLLKANIDTANNSEDTGTLQALKALDSIESKIEQVRVAYQQFYTTVGIENVWKGALDGLKNYINYLNSLPKLFSKFPLSALAVASNVIGILKMLGEHLIGTIAQAWEKGLTKSQQEAQKTNAGEEIINQLNEKNEAIRNAGREAGRAMGQGFSEGVAEGASQTTTTLMNKAAEASTAIGSSTAQQQQAGKVPTTSQTQKDVATKDTATTNVSNWFSSAIKDVDLSADTTTIVASMTTMAAEASNTLKPEMEAVGRDGGISIVQGLLESTGMTAEAARTLAITIIDTMRSALNMHSPSPTIIAMFENGVGEAIALGLEASYDEVATAAEKLGLSVSDNLKQAFESSSKINLSDHFEKGDAQKLIQQVAKDKSVELSQVALPSNKIVSGKDSKLVLREDGLTEEQYQAFQSRYNENKKQYQAAIKPIHNRQEEVSSEIQALEQEAESLRQEAIRKAYANNDKSRAEHYESQMRDFNALLPGEKYDRLYDLKNEKASLSQQEQTIRKRAQLEHNKIETEENAAKQANQQLLIQEKAEAEARARAQQEKEEEEARKAKEDAERKAREEAENTRKIEEANQRSAERLAKERTLPEAYIPKNHARVEPRDREAFVGEVAPNRPNTTVTASLDELRAATREAGQVTPIDLEDAKAKGQEAGTVIREEITQALDDKVPGPEIETDKTEEAAKETAELITKVADTAQDNKDETIDSPINPDQVKSDVDATMTELQKLEAEYDKLRGQGASAALHANFEGETEEYAYTQTLRSALGQKTFNQPQTTQNQQDTQSSTQDTNAQVAEAEQLAQAKAQEAAEVEQLRQKYLQLIETKKQSSDITDEKAKELAQQAQEIQNVEELKKKTEELNQAKKETTKGQEEKPPVSSDTPGIIDRAKAGLTSLHDTIQNNSKAFGTWSRAIGMGLSSITSFIDTTTQGGEAAKNAIVGIGGAISMVGAIVSHAGPMAVISAAITAITGAIAFIKSFSLDAQIERAEKQAEELTNSAKKAKAEYKSLDNGIKKLDELKEKRYESAEAAEEYQGAVEELAGKFPQLITGFDNAGNVIIDTTNAEEVLAKARQASAKATFEAAQAELDAAKLNAKKALGETIKQSNKLTTIATQDGARVVDQDFIQKQKTNMSKQNITDQDARTALSGIDPLWNIEDQLHEMTIAYINEAVTGSHTLDDYAFLTKGYNSADDSYSLQKLLDYLNSKNSEELTSIESDFLTQFKAADKGTVQLANELNNAITEYNNLEETTSIEDRIAAFDKARQAFQAAKKGNAILSDNELKQLEEAFGENSLALDDYTTKLEAVAGLRKQVIGQWQQTQTNDGKAWEYLEESAAASALVTKTIDDAWTKYETDHKATFKVNDTNYDNIIRKANQTDPIAEMNDFWLHLSDTQQKLFDKMFSDTQNYTAEDFEEVFGKIPGFDKIMPMINNYYNDGITSISTRLNAELAKVLGRKSDREGKFEKIEASEFQEGTFFRAFAEAKNKNNITRMEESQLNTILNEYEKLSQAGYHGRAESFGLEAMSLFSQIDSAPAAIEKQLWQLIENNSLHTLEGLQKIKDSIANNSELSQYIDTDILDRLQNNIIPNINLEIQTATSNLLDTWEDTSKTLSSALSGGVSLKDADQLIQKAKSMGLDFDMSDFQLVGDKLVLVGESFDEYYKAITGSAETTAEEWQKRINEGGRLLAGAASSKSYRYTEKDQALLSSLGFDITNTKYYNNGVLTSDGIIALQQAINENQKALDNYNMAAKVAAQQLLHQHEFSKGIYKIGDTVQSVEDLKKIVGANVQLTKDQIDERAIKESVNSVYSTLLSDVVSKGLENINLADYEGLIQSDARRLAHLKETSNAEYIIREYAVLAGKSLEEVDELLAQNTQRTTSRYSQAIKEVLNYDSDGYISEVTKSLGVSHAELKNNSEQAIIKAKAFLDELAKQIGKAGYSLEEYNSEAKSILDKTLFNQGGNARALLDFASGDIGADALESLANSFGLQLDQLVDVTTGIVQGDIGKYLNYNASTGNYDIQGTFGNFVSTLEEQFEIKIDHTSKAYVDALKAWNDASIEKEHEVDKAITEELKNVASAKVGDKINLAQTYSTLFSNLDEISEQALAKRFASLNASFSNGILTLESGANIQGIIQLIVDQAKSAGQMIPEEIAELKDAIVETLKSITNLISNGIEGSLSNVDKLQLENWAAQYDIVDLQFSQTADGFKLANDSAIELYNTVRDLDSIQGQIVFEKLKDNLIATDDNFKSISAAAAHMAEVESKLNFEKYKKEIKEANEQVALFDEMMSNGNVDLYNRTKHLNEDGSYSTLLTTTFDSRNFETDVPWVANVTPLTKDGKLLDEEYVIEYIQDLIDGADGKLEGILEADKENLGLIIEMVDAANKDQDALAESMGKRGELLHEISEAYEAIKDGETYDNTKIKQYEEELRLAREIEATRATTEDSSFSFMSNKIPGGQNNPLNYLGDWSKAFSVMKEAGKDKNMIDYTDFYNIITEMGNLAEQSGEIKLSATQVLNNAEDAAALIEQGANALSITADGSIKVDLGKLGIDFSTGASDLKANVGKGIKDIANSQIKMLDSMIQLLETIVAMEELGDIDVEGNGIDFSELFDRVSFEEFGSSAEMFKWTTGAQDAINNILEMAKTNKDLAKSLDTVIVNGVSMRKMFESAKNGETLNKESAQAYHAAIAAFYDAMRSGNYDLNNIMASIKEVLAGTDFEGEIQLGDQTLVFARGQTLIKLKDGTYKGEHTDKSYKTAAEAAQAEALIGAGVKEGNINSGKADSEGNYHYTGTMKIDQTEFEVTLDENNKPVYTSKDGETFASEFEAAQHAYEEYKEDKIQNYSTFETYAEWSVRVYGKFIAGTVEIENQAQFQARTHDQVQELAAAILDVKNNPDGVIETAAKIGIKVEETNGTITEEQLQALSTIAGIESKTVAMDAQIKASGDEKLVELINQETPTIDLNVNVSLVGEDADLLRDLQNPQTSTNKNKATDKDSKTSASVDPSDADKKFQELINKRKEYQKPMQSMATLDNKSAIKGFKEITEQENLIEGKNPVKVEIGEEIQTNDETKEHLHQIYERQTDIENKSQIIIDVSSPDAPGVAAELGAVAEAAASIPTDIGINVSISTSDSFPSFGGNGKFSGGGGSNAFNFTHATGNVGVANAKGTLMGELGPELVVSHGRYFVAGQNGAEFIDLSDDAIVFNHLQTEQLLKHGMSTQRGQAVTNEYNAVSFATGNVNGGPAMASARAALAALKQLRAQWQAIAGMSAQDMAGLGGSGGGGGGGGDKANDPKAFVKELEIWYNWLQRIAVLEEKITMEEAKRSKFQSDFIRSGENYAKSNLDTLKYLREQAVINQSLVDSQQKYFDQRRAQMNAASNPFSALYTFDEYGQLRYKNAGFQNLSKLSGRDSLTGQGNLSAADQYATLVSMGFEKYMQYDSSGNKIDTSGEDWEVTAVQAFWDKVDSDKEEMQSLHDSIEEHKKAVVENQQKANEIMHEIEDNQMSVEDKILKAIESARQREIDELQKERDAIEEASQNLIDGLSKQLEKERDMYSQQETQDELAQLQRRAAILRSSGGSQGDIASLYNDITQKQQDMYFDAQQRQIDALQEATDAQLEKLDAQLDLMNETLAYEKENGLLWNEVYNVMNLSAEEIADFITRYDSDYWGQSATRTAADYREALFEADQFKTYQSQMEGGLSAIVNSFTDYAIKQDAKIEQAKQDAITAANASINIVRGEIKATTSGGGGSPAPASTPAPASSSAQPQKGHGYSVNIDGKVVKNSGYKTAAEAANAAQAVISSTISMSRGQAKISGLSVYDRGGIVDNDQIALVHAKESVLTPQQTSILRNDILGNQPNSLMNLLLDFKNAYGNIPNSANITNTTNGVTIEQAIVEMHVSQIANDYDAQRAGEQALDKIIQIARKSQGQNRVGR